MKLLEDAIAANPFEITSPLGVNAPDSFDFTEFDWNDLCNWAQVDCKLEVFGGNHLLEASKNIIKTPGFFSQEEDVSKYIQNRPCVVYQGLTDDEMLLVNILI